MKTALFILCAAAVLALLENFRELHTFQVTEYEIRSGKLRKPFTAVFLSDLHNHRYGQGNEKLLEAVRAARPDLILIGGDMLVGKRGRGYEAALEFVKELPAIAPVYYANGNHEQRVKEDPDSYEIAYETYRRDLEHSGVKFLENSSVRLLAGGANVRLVGLEIPLRCYTHFHREPLGMEEIRERIGDCEGEEYHILLAHNPSYEEQYFAWGADLLLSGHLHGGLIRIPGIGAVFSPSFELFPRHSAGLRQKGGQAALVSKGLGTHTFHVRLFNPAEMAVLRLRGEAETP